MDRDPLQGLEDDLAAQAEFAFPRAPACARLLGAGRGAAGGIANRRGRIGHLPGSRCDLTLRRYTLVETDPSGEERCCASRRQPNSLDDPRVLARNESGRVSGFATTLRLP